MSDNNVENVDKDIKTICCDGGEDSLGHPAVYYSFDESNKVVCSYCGKIYIKDKKVE
tara:strand:- start:189 stop:359 length:171 start_codon:yes stop_codon:yes gene_type:complete